MDSVTKQEPGKRKGSAHVLVVAASTARRSSLSQLVLRSFKRGAVKVTTSSAPPPGSAADIVLADLDTQSMADSFIRFIGESSGPAAVALIDDPDPRWVQASLQAGINAVISREPSAEELHLALAAAGAGLVLLHPSSARSLAAMHLRRSDPAYDQEQLTPREREVLRLLSDGMGNKEIASRLAISEHTAKFHISSILGKLSVASRTEAVSQGIRKGIIPI
jgi:two-component system, NarL family, response regulator YdfI